MPRHHPFAVSIASESSVECRTQICNVIWMANKFPFGADGPVSEMMKLQRERSDLIRRALGPSFVLNELPRMSAVRPDFDVSGTRGILTAAEKIRGTRIGQIMAAADAYRLNKLFTLQDYATPSWMAALRKTSFEMNSNPSDILSTQRVVVGSAIADMAKLGALFEANRSVVGKLMMISSIGDQFRAMSHALAPQLDILKTAAERARMIDMMTVRATAGAVATSSAIALVDQVVEAQRIIEAISNTEDASQSTHLVVQFITLMSVMFSRFGENTLNEMRNIGAVTLIGVLMTFQGIYKEISPQNLTPAEQKAHSEIVDHVSTIQEKLDEILSMDEAAKNAYVDRYPRGELKRHAVLRQEPSGKAQVLIRSDAGTLIAIKERRGNWFLAVYRDPLSDQLSEGWVNAPAVQLLDKPTPAK